MRTLEEIDLEILEKAKIPTEGKMPPWHDPQFIYAMAVAFKMLGKKYREMYHILRDLNDYLETDFNQPWTGSLNESQRKKDMKQRLGAL